MISVNLRHSLLECIQAIDEDFSLFFGQLRYLLIFNHGELNAEETNAILDLFTYGLENSKINNQEKWIRNNSGYFGGNAFISDLWKQKFNTGDFTHNSLVEYMNEIKAEPTKSNFDFSLRNVEVTLRDDVTFNNTPVYKDICRSVLNDILNGKAR